MDVITQTILGATAAGAVFNHKLGRVALLVGAVGGALPDADSLLESVSDPALPWQWHRHFTHALVFIPVAGALAALPFLAVPKLRAKWKLVLGAAIIGCATHGLLDACTSFGTHLLWPFTNDRAAWDVVSIIDPVAELPLWLFALIALIFRSAWASRLGLIWFVGYLLTGYVQHERAEHAQQRLAESRGHVIERGRVMPTFANIIVWRSVYEHNGRLHADAIRAPIGGGITVREGDRSVPALDVEAMAPELTQRQQFVVNHFAHFADGYIAWHPDIPNLIGDMRYSMTTNAFEPIWGIRLIDDTIPPDVQWAFLRDGDRNRVEALLDDVLTGGTGFRSISTVLSDKRMPPEPESANE